MRLYRAAQRKAGFVSRRTLLPPSDADRHDQNWIVDGVVVQGSRRRASKAVSADYLTRTRRRANHAAGARTDDNAALAPLAARRK